MIAIPKGLYEVLTSDKLTNKEKKESTMLFSYPVQNLDHVEDGVIFEERPVLSEEDARMICDAIDNGTLEEVV